jgi:hypothetical protein
LGRSRSAVLEWRLEASVAVWRCDRGAISLAIGLLELQELEVKTLGLVLAFLLQASAPLEKTFLGEAATDSGLKPSPAPGSAEPFTSRRSIFVSPRCDELNCSLLSLGLGVVLVSHSESPVMVCLQSRSQPVEYRSQ